MNQFKHPRTMIGLLLIVIGGLFILMNLGYIEHVPVHRFWPVILIMIGLGKLLQSDRPKARWDGVWMVLLGVWFQLVTLRTFGFTYRNSWPIMLIVWGIYLAGSALARSSAMTTAQEEHNGN